MKTIGRRSFSIICPICNCRQTAFYYMKEQLKEQEIKCIAPECKNIFPYKEVAMAISLTIEDFVYDDALTARESI